MCACENSKYTPTHMHMITTNIDKNDDVKTSFLPATRWHTSTTVTVLVCFQLCDHRPFCTQNCRE